MFYAELGWQISARLFILTEQGNQTDNVLPSDVREQKSEIIDFGVDKFSTHNNFIFREWEFRYVRTSITKVEIMLAITVWASILLIAFTATSVDIYYAVLKNENGGKQVVDPVERGTIDEYNWQEVSQVLLLWLTKRWNLFADKVGCYLLMHS